MCKKSGVKFIVNDDPFIANEVDADGVHLGQEDLKKHSLVRSFITADGGHGGEGAVMVTLAD